MSDGVIGSCGNEGRGGVEGNTFRGRSGSARHGQCCKESWEGRSKGRAPDHVLSRWEKEPAQSFCTSQLGNADWLRQI